MSNSLKRTLIISILMLLAGAGALDMFGVSFIGITLMSLGGLGCIFAPALVKIK